MVVNSLRAENISKVSPKYLAIQQINYRADCGNKTLTLQPTLVLQPSPYAARYSTGVGAFLSVENGAMDTNFSF